MMYSKGIKEEESMKIQKIADDMREVKFQLETLIKVVTQSKNMDNGGLQLNSLNTRSANTCYSMKSESMQTNKRKLPLKCSNGRMLMHAPLDDDKNNKDQYSLGFIGFHQSLKEAATLAFWRDAVCEMFVVFFMVFGTTLATVSFPGNPASVTPIALTAGLYVFVLIEGFAHLQKACMNPLVLVTFVCTKRLGFVRAIVYLTFELIGSVLAALLVCFVTPVEFRENVKPLVVGAGVTTAGALLVEAVVSAALVFVGLGSLDRGRRQVFLPGLPIGITITVGIFAAERYTGGCMNPLIPFGPAAATAQWDNHWIYWVGDIGGTLVAILFYFLFRRSGPPFGPRKGNELQIDTDLEKETNLTELKKEHLGKNTLVTITRI